MVYYPYMASIVGKKRGNATYYYLVESARWNGQPRIVSQEYLGTAEERPGARRGAGLGLPGGPQHKHCGAVAAAWGMREDLGVAAIIDEVTRARRSDAGASTGTYLALAALGRLVAPCSKLAFADWWAGTAAGRFTGIGTPALDPRPFWDAMHAAGLEELEEISPRIAPAILHAARADCTPPAAGRAPARRPAARARGVGTAGGARRALPPRREVSGPAPRAPLPHPPGLPESRPRGFPAPPWPRAGGTGDGRAPPPARGKPR